MTAEPYRVQPNPRGVAAPSELTANREKQDLNHDHSQSTPTAILVLGMHRSGTSALTRVISLLGADLPSNLMPPAKENNDTGFWESLDVYRLNEEILAANGSRWDDWGQLGADWWTLADNHQFKTQAIALLERDFHRSSMFVLKDPRLCRLLPFWLEVLTQFGAHVKCVLSFRNPIEVAKSLATRDGISSAAAYALWLRHTLDAERRTREIPRVFVAYHELLKNWRDTIHTISTQLRLTWPAPIDAAAERVGDFLDAGLRHQLAHDRDVLADAAFPSMVATAYRALIALQAEPTQPRALASLEQVAAEFERAVEVFSGAAANDDNRYQKEAVILQARITELTRALEDRDGRLAALESVSNTRKALIKKLELSISTLSRTIDVKEARLSALQSVSRDRKGLIDKLEQGILGREARIERLSKATEGLRSALANRADRIANLEKARVRETEYLTSLLTAEKDANNALTRINRQLLRRLNSVQTSAAWQLGLPLRLADRCCAGLTQLLARVSRLTWWSLHGRYRTRLHERRQARRLIAAGAFDEDWYIQKNPDVVLAGYEPIRHWITHGWREGRAPNSVVSIGTLSEDVADGVGALDLCVTKILDQCEAARNSDGKQPK